MRIALFIFVGLRLGVRPVENILATYHELERDISYKAASTGLAVDSGLNAKQVYEWLDSELAADVVDEEVSNNKVEEGNTGGPSLRYSGCTSLGWSTRSLWVYRSLREG
ncbi:hypothetical protein BDV38DRAFT_277629 [Aspergillus pseudotamarii]|uniref:Uncharacterized protein n=1 Tax=Aspergillus pseudotamarii TaxID=132259 RepID=A0A5N6T9G4_ASPPS|nr:uncharacterized protein BDV38DRAFT_277629 [Aspergillus pseudotamarii]KAE8142811.1 hypothetical protein BDV38DRAFT_277629 [Aspergillus pseudotamarii]